MNDFEPPVTDDTALRARLHELWERTNDEPLRRLAAGEPPRDDAAFTTPQERADWTSTCLMDAFKSTHDEQVLALLYDLHHTGFRRVIHGALRRTRCGVEADDVLQEVFLNICRYPSQFVAERADSFSRWGHRIVRNTLYKLVRSRIRQPEPLDIDPDGALAEDRGASQPERVAADHESAPAADLAYVLYLTLYHRGYRRLSRPDRQLLKAVELDGRRYADIAAEAGVTPNSIKVRVFRARRRIGHDVAEALAALRDASEAGGAANAAA